MRKTELKQLRLRKKRAGYEKRCLPVIVVNIFFYYSPYYLLLLRRSIRVGILRNTDFTSFFDKKFGIVRLGCCSRFWATLPLIVLIASCLSILTMMS